MCGKSWINTLFQFSRLCIQITCVCIGLFIWVTRLGSFLLSLCTLSASVLYTCISINNPAVYHSLTLLSDGRVGFNQTSFTVRENDRALHVCAKFTKYNLRPACPMKVTININIASVNNTAGNTHSVFLTIWYMYVRYMSVFLHTPY